MLRVADALTRGQNNNRPVIRRLEMCTVQTFLLR